MTSESSPRVTEPTGKICCNKFDVLPIFIKEVVVAKIFMVGVNKMFNGMLIHNSTFFKKVSISTTIEM
jgi:hypothetical protein